jgi:multiple sugar transport system permease protein
MLAPPRFAGLVNYRTAFAGDPLFWKSMWNTLYYTVLSVPLGLAGSLACALLLNQRIGARNVFRTLFYLPAITPVVASTLIWTWLLRSDFGLVNIILARIGISGPKWLGSTTWAMPAIVLISLWGVGGPRAMIFLAGLQGIDAELYEAAHIDGAGSFRKFLMITLPMLSPTILFNSIIGIIQSFQAFTVAFIATGGGPANATLFYVLHLYRNAFEYFEVGYGAALAWILFAIIFALTLLQLRLSKRWVFYGGS